MKLITLWALDTLLTAIVISSVIAALPALLAKKYRLGGTAGFARRFVVLLAFSLLGFAIGHLMGNSRDSAVGTVVPAVLTLIGGVAAYAAGFKGPSEQLKVAALLVTFTLALIIGSVAGIQNRVDVDSDSEEPEYLRKRGLALENARRAIEVERLLHYIDFLKLQRDLGKEESLDLSRFESVYEKSREKKTDEEKGSSKKPSKGP